MPQAKTKKSRTPPKAKPAALSPRTRREAPTEGRATHLLSRVAGVRVTEDTALTLGAVFACVRVITEDLAGLPWRVHEKLPSGGSIDRPEDPADWLLNTQASPDTPAFQFRETIIAHALLWGNGYAEIERDLADRPAWLWLLTPDRVTPFRHEGEIYYEVRNPGTGPSYLPARDVFHLRGLGFDGLTGYSVVQLAARSIGAGIALDQSTTDLFANDSTPGGLLTHPGRISEGAAKRLAESWEKRHQGPANRRRVAVLEEGMAWQQTGLPPDDTKLIEQRQFTPSDVCRWFRVAPHKIADLARATFSNIEQQNIDHVTSTLMPWVRRLETEANIKLFGRTNRGRRFTRINVNALMRGDVASRAGFYNSMLDRGVFSVNDVLALEDRNPIGPDGDKRLVPLNMQLLEKVGEDPPAPPAPAPLAETVPAPADDGDDDTPQLSHLQPVFEDACRRVLSREVDRAKAAAKEADVAAWLAKIHDDHAAYVRGTLRPAAAALALSVGAEPGRLDAAVAVVTDAHMARFRGWVAGRQGATPPADPSPVELATGWMAQLTAAVGAIK